MPIDKELVKEYINENFSFRNRVEEINSISIETIDMVSYERQFFLIDWSGWRLQPDGESWTYRNGLKSIRFNPTGYNQWLCVRRNLIIDSVII